MRVIDFELSGTIGSNAVPGGNLSKVLEGPIDFLHFTIKQTAGAGAVAEFSLDVRDHPDAPFHGEIGGTDWTATNNPRILFCTTQAPNDLTTGAESSVKLNLFGAHSIRFNFGTSVSATVVIRGTYGIKE